MYSLHPPIPGPTYTLKDKGWENLSVLFNNKVQIFIMVPVTSSTEQLWLKGGHLQNVCTVSGDRKRKLWTEPMKLYMISFVFQMLCIEFETFFGSSFLFGGFCSIWYQSKKPESVWYCLIRKECVSSTDQTMLLHLYSLTNHTVCLLRVRDPWFSSNYRILYAVNCGTQLIFYA